MWSNHGKKEQPQRNNWSHYKALAKLSRSKCRVTTKQPRYDSAEETRINPEETSGQA